MPNETRGLTRPIPSPSVAENANKMWTVGSNTAINFSSPSRNLLKAWACVRSRSETAFELSQASSWVAKGCVSRRFLVTLAYSVEAALNMAVKLSVEVEGPADRLLVDIGITREEAQVWDESGLRESVDEYSAANGQRAFPDRA